jgi:hypothetical protein
MSLFRTRYSIFFASGILSACQGGLINNFSGMATSPPWVGGALGTGTDIAGATGLTIDPAVAASLAATAPNPILIRRLSNVEYNYTVRDLLGTKRTPADNFLPDMAGSFDTIGANLLVSEVHLTNYLTAAEVLAAEAADPKTSGIPEAVACAAGEKEGDCVARVLPTLAKRAWRRPVTPEEQSVLVNLANASQDTTPVGKISLGLQAILMSPHFLFHVELDDEPASTNVKALDDYELATRLAYYLWSTMPDAALTAAADAGNLHEDAVLVAQIDRMLADPKAQTLVSHFAFSWLGLNGAATFVPHAKNYPDFTPEIRSAMITETQTFLNDYILGELKLPGMLDANYTYLNGNLAKYYGISATTGTDFTKVALPEESNRAGVLTQGTMLIATSDPDGTNLIRRGKLIASSLLCIALGPPPAGAGALPAQAAGPNLTQRQRLERHVVDKSCASCHDVMDPLGFAFEGFGPTAKARATDNGSPVDTTGTYEDQHFDNAAQLSAIVAQSASLNRCATKNMFIYAVGAQPVSADNPTLNAVTSAYVGAGGKVRDMVRILALSNPFRQRRAQGTST